uniref:DDB1- and CUL4-associated factor 15 WD40 repeat-containing domain-containing protein n=1 Tax=Oncorhynchus tshawytscha TaxID=74940 RepID=A0AAZ3R659_ONCTS
MAPSSKSEKDGNKQTQRKHKEHVVKLLNRGKLSGQYSQRLFRKLPPRVCVPLKNIVSEEFLRAGHIFLGFTKCGRYVLSYTSDCGEDDDFSFYTYHLYWWEFNLHSRLKQVHHVRLFTGEDIYSDLYLTVCEWPNDHSKIVIFGFNTRSSSSVLMNLMMSDENNRDIYITIASMPPLRPCSQCFSLSLGSGECLGHGYMLNSRYQVVYPFPTFQPAFQLKKDQVIFLNTSYSLVACSVSLSGEQGHSSQILFRKRATAPTLEHQTPPSPSSSSSSHGSPDSRLLTAKPSPAPLSPSQSQAAARAREFAADLFRRAQGGGRENEGGERRGKPEGSEDSIQCSAVTSPASSSSSTPTPHSSQEAGCSEPGYVNYTRLQYRMPQPGAPEQDAGEHASVCVLLRVCVCYCFRPVVKQKMLKCVSVLQSVCVEQLTLDFEYLINEVIRSDARWAAQFCSFNDYDVVILEVHIYTIHLYIYTPIYIHTIHLYIYTHYTPIYIHTIHLYIYTLYTYIYTLYTYIYTYIYTLYTYIYTIDLYIHYRPIYTLYTYIYTLYTYIYTYIYTLYTYIYTIDLYIHYRPIYTL